MMKFVIFLLSLLDLVVFYGADALECYTCDFAGTNPARVCKEFQTVTTCDYQQVCLTMTHSETTHDDDSENGESSTLHFFRKQCVEGGMAECLNTCNTLTSVDPSQCKVSCCNDNRCNGDVDERKIWFALFSSSAATKTFHVSYMLVFCSLVMVYIMCRP